MRDFGSIQSPQNAFLLNMGLESLHVRMAQHCKNGQSVAEFLSGHPKVAWVRYCGLPDDPNYELAQKYLPNGSCGVVSFGVKGGREAAERFMANLKLAQIATHVADARTCVLHPANATHRQMNDEELAAAGISPDLVRLSWRHRRHCRPHCRYRSGPFVCLANTSVQMPRCRDCPEQAFAVARTALGSFGGGVLAAGPICGPTTAAPGSLNRAPNLGQDKPRFGGAVFYGLRTIMAGGLALREWTRSRRGHLMQSIKLESSFHHA